jgi:hypothetical protein
MFALEDRLFWEIILLILCRLIQKSLLKLMDHSMLIRSFMIKREQNTYHPLDIKCCVIGIIVLIPPSGAVRHLPLLATLHTHL